QLMREALELARGNPDAGIELLRRGAELEPDNHKIRLALAELLIANNLYDEAATLLTALPANIATSDAARVLQSRLELRRLLAPADDDNDTAVATWRATRELFEQGQYDAALDTLGELVEQRDERARDAMLKLFALPEVDNDSRTRWRRRLASLLN
ncbi:MAG: tetratricopeptide repeat protein, partial [Gammaproteobacteria bacterium]|nr:tetratricopeptide repeat protein [Gammaproteobacteria bacterium]